VVISPEELVVVRPTTTDPLNEPPPPARDAVAWACECGLAANGTVTPFACLVVASAGGRYGVALERILARDVVPTSSKFTLKPAGG